MYLTKKLGEEMIRENNELEKKKNSHDFAEFLGENSNSFLILFCWLILAYGMKIFHLSLSHDTEAIISVPDSLYNSWISLGRYGLLIIKKIFGVYRFNPYLASMLMIATMMAGAIVWEYFFYKITTNDNDFSKRSWVMPAFLFTAPVMAEQMSFLLQSFEVSLAFLMIGLALHIIWYGIIERKYWPHVLSILLLSLCFSCYQTFVPLFIAASIMSFLIYFDKQKIYWRAIICLVVNFLGGLFLYKVIDKFVINYTGIVPASYLTDYILWKKHSWLTCVLNVLRQMKEVVIAQDTTYYSYAFPISIIMAFIIIIRVFKKNMQYKFLYALCFCVLFVTPFLMTILMGQRPNFRTLIILPFVYGFVFQYFLSRLENYTSKRLHIFKKIIVIISVLLLFRQCTITADMFYSEYVQYEEDVRLAIKITDRIDQLNLGENPQEPVVFIGSRMPRLNPSANGGYENPGNSFYEWSFTNIYGSFIMKNFMTTLGYPYNSPTEEQVKFAELYAIEHMPCWPDRGSVCVENGVIIIRLS